MQARQAGQNVMFQIYLNKDRAQSEKLLAKVTKLGAAAIMFTVDTPYMSKRTRDRRAKTPTKVEVRSVLICKRGLTDAPVPDQVYRVGRGGGKAVCCARGRVAGYQRVPGHEFDVEGYLVHPGECAEGKAQWNTTLTSAEKHAPAHYCQGYPVDRRRANVCRRGRRGHHSFQPRRTAVRLVSVQQD
jgi:hypothetical protein